MDFDSAGMMNVENFAKKLGKNRTKIVMQNENYPNVKDANDALKISDELVLN